MEITIPRLTEYEIAIDYLQQTPISDRQVRSYIDMAIARLQMLKKRELRELNK